MRFAFFRPTEFIARFMLIRLARLLGFPQNLTHIFMVIYRISHLIISNVGYFPTIRVLLRLRRLVAFGLPLSRFNLSTFLPLNEYAVELITNNLTGSWGKILENAKTFLRIFNFFLFPFVALSGVFPFIKFLVRSSIYTILGSIGILWNFGDTTFSSIKFIAEYVVDFVQNYFNIDIPRPSEEQIIDNIHHEHKPHNIQENIDPKSSSWLTGLIIFALGITVTISGIIIAEYIAPETVHNTPIINTICDCIHISWYYLTHLTNNFPGPDSGLGGGNTNTVRSWFVDK